MLKFNKKSGLKKYIQNYFFVQKTDLAMCGRVKNSKSLKKQYIKIYMINFNVTIFNRLRIFRFYKYMVDSYKSCHF